MKQVRFGGYGAPMFRHRAAQLSPLLRLAAPPAPSEARSLGRLSATQLLLLIAVLISVHCEVSGASCSLPQRDARSAVHLSSEPASIAL